jgi:exonuclease SbcD
VDVRQSPEPQARVLAALDKRSVTDAVVRVKIDALPEQAAAIRTDEIRQQLEEAGAFFVAAVAVDVERKSRSRLQVDGGDLLEGLTPRRALELYLRAKTPPLSEERIRALLGAADELFAEQGPSF